MFHPTRPQGLDSVRSLVHRACGTGEVEDVVHRATLDRMADVPFDNSKREPPHRCSMFASRPVSCRKTRLRSSPRLKVVREVLPALRHPAADATDPALRPAQALPTPCLSRPRRRYSPRWKYSSIPAKNRPSYGIAYV